MPAEVKDRVHALTRRANAKRGLTFTDSHGNNLDELYPDADEDNDSDYDTSANDDASYASSEDSDYTLILTTAPLMTVPPTDLPIMTFSKIPISQLYSRLRLQE
jgi:hypothetical protein